MIKKLRIKFIIASMVSILFVMVATIGAINISNYVSVQKEVNNALALVIENGLNDEPQGGPGHRPEDIQREHYFIVSFNSDGSVNQSNFKHIFIVNESAGIELATTVFNGSSSYGKIDNLYYNRYAGFVTEWLITLYFLKNSDMLKIAHAEKKFIF